MRLISQPDPLLTEPTDKTNKNLLLHELRIRKMVLYVNEILSQDFITTCSVETGKYSRMKAKMAKVPSF
jgi:hypothetical protein